MIHLSQSAINEIDRLKSQQIGPTNAANTNFRLTVATKGCAGLTYQLGFDPVIQPTDALVQVDTLAVAIDARSVDYVQGLLIDYTEDLMGGGFQFTNPQAVSVCDCGMSFAVAIDNTQEWQVDCGL
jgi:iron-sulfur cluster assembly protein